MCLSGLQKENNTMPQVLNIVGDYFGGAPHASTEEAPQALDRLQRMLTTEVSVTEGAPPASDPPVQLLDPAALQVKWLKAPPKATVNTGVVTSQVHQESADDVPREVAQQEAQTTEGAQPEASAGTRDQLVAVDEVPAEWDNEAEFQGAVEKARLQAEAQLKAAVAQIRQATADQHAAEVAEAVTEVTSRHEEAEAEAGRAREERERQHAEELRQVRESLATEVASAVDRVRHEEAGRHAAELLQTREALERRHASELKRARLTVIESFQALTASILQSG